MILFFLTVAMPEEQDKVIYIYRNYYSCMAYTASKYLKEPSDIEDTVHDSMVKLLGMIESIDTSDELRLRHLCCVVARNIAINRVKVSSRNSLPLEEVFDVSTEDTPESITVSNDTVRVLVDAIDTLKDTYRDVCRLKYINQLKEKDIAELLDLPEKTVNQRIFRGKQILRKALAKEKVNG